MQDLSGRENYRNETEHIFPAAVCNLFCDLTSLATKFVPEEKVLILS